MFGQRFDGGFAAIVGRVSGWIGDALFTSRDDDSARVPGLEAWYKGIEAVDDTEKVGVQNLRSLVSFNSVDAVRNTLSK